VGNGTEARIRGQRVHVDEIGSLENGLSLCEENGVLVGFVW